jgi:hypothetical protein
MSSEYREKQKKLMDKLERLMVHVWSNGYDKRNIDTWLKNFDGSFCQDIEKEKYFALHLLSHFLFFNQNMVRQMLSSAYADLYVVPLKQEIRKKLDNTLDYKIIQEYFKSELEKTLFIGAGNPSESGAHLLYYFRQVNNLSKERFSDFYGVFSEKIIDQVYGVPTNVEVGFLRKDISKIVFFDDLVGSGTQITDYLKARIAAIRSSAPDVKLQFISLFCTKKAMDMLNLPDMFDSQASSLFLLDETFKAFHEKSRNFKKDGEPSNNELENFCRHYGESLLQQHPLGYKDGQLMIGFSYNTPDNTLPIFWFSHQWKPIFQRYSKIY